MSLDEEVRRQAAASLRASARDRRPIPPLTSTFTGFDVEDAYAVQLINVEAGIAAGQQIIGHKVGLTAPAMQKMLGVDEPDYGHLLDDMLMADGATVPIINYQQPRVEIEIGFLLGAELAGPGVTVDDVIDAAAYVVPSIEIIDSRIIDWRITLADTIADNASSAGLVLGGQRIRPDAIDLPAVEATMWVNDEVVATGTGDAVLGHPAAAVAWLANVLGPRGVQLGAGHVVLPGSCTKALDVRPGDHVRATFADLGSVDVSFS